MKKNIMGLLLISGMLLNAQSEKIIDLSFGSGTQPTGGGCTFTTINHNGTGTYTTTAAFGPTPIQFGGYNVRGFGKPQRSIYIKGVALKASNKLVTDVSYNPFTGKDESMSYGFPTSSALSIEYNFEPKYTYEILVNVITEDNIYKVKRNINNQYYNDYNVPQSEKSPIIVGEFSPTVTIDGGDPCADHSFRYFFKPDSKKADIVIGSDRGNDHQTVKILIAIDQPMKSITINFMPNLGTNMSQIYQSNYSIYVQNITINRLPYDEKMVVQTKLTESNGGFRGSAN